ncbi:dinitrogenase iron-molybdenum cofactor biosynthesis protein [Candidatus Woesearchaeota archaeon]|nr:dinitrogenase iron-molybdenum cofactor biosynthesis protein [Candidatus Woesearchaeota archaeon]
MRIAIPIMQDNEEAEISPHFGRAPFFAIFDSETKEISFIKNTSEHFGGHGKPAEVIAEQKPDIVFALDMGSKAIAVFESYNIKVKTGECLTLKDVIDSKDMLDELESSCGH